MNNTYIHIRILIFCDEIFYKTCDLSIVMFQKQQSGIVGWRQGKNFAGGIKNDYTLAVLTVTPNIFEMGF